MKRIFAIASIAFAFAASSHAQSMNKLIKAFEANKNTQHQNMTQEMLKMTIDKSDSSSMENFDFMNRVEKMEVFQLEDYENKKPKKIIQQMDNFKEGDGYEMLINVNEDQGKMNHVKIVTQKMGNTISELAILVRDERELVLVRFIGNLSMNDVQKIMNEQKGKFQNNN